MLTIFYTEQMLSEGERGHHHHHTFVFQNDSILTKISYFQCEFYLYQIIKELPLRHFDLI